MSEEVEELKPCPFCGSQGLDYFGNSKVSPPAYLIFVKCNSCNACSGVAAGKKEKQAKLEAAKLWNRRVNDAL